jgi:hypothetical protein
MPWLVVNLTFIKRLTMYTGVILNCEDQQLLFERFRPLLNLYLPNFVDRSPQEQPLGHHMTMNMGPCKHRTLLGKKVLLTLDAWAADERVCAVRVKDHTGVYCDNETPHITLYVNPSRGGSPRHSNGLLSWVPLEEEIVVTGVVMEV